MIESMDKLREWANVSGEPWAESRERLHRMLDEIEAEIEERFMELPVDVNNEPVHIGDEMEHRSKHETLDVIAVGNDSFFTGRWADDYVRCFEVSAEWHHAKPRTLEDVLADFAAEVENDRNTIETARKYAEEIRELLGVEE